MSQLFVPIQSFSGVQVKKLLAVPPDFVPIALHKTESWKGSHCFGPRKYLSDLAAETFEEIKKTLNKANAKKMNTKLPLIKPFLLYIFIFNEIFYVENDTIIPLQEFL